MEVEETKIMNLSRQSSQESQFQMIAVSTPANTSSNAPLDNVRAVAVETTPNPPSYWPPPSLSAANFFRESMGDTRPMTFQKNSFFGGEAKRKKCGFAGGNGSNDKGEEMEEEESNRRAEDGSSESARILHHNLPPIASITSSSNYKVARELVQKRSHPGILDRPTRTELDGREFRSSEVSHEDSGKAVKIAVSLEKGKGALETKGKLSENREAAETKLTTSGPPDFAVSCRVPTPPHVQTGGTDVPIVPRERLDHLVNDSCSSNLFSPSSTPSLGHNFSPHYSGHSAATASGQCSAPSSSFAPETAASPSSIAPSPVTPAKMIHSPLKLSSFQERKDSPSDPHRLWELQSNIVHTTLPYVSDSRSKLTHVETVNANDLAKQKAFSNPTKISARGDQTWREFSKLQKANGNHLLHPDLRPDAAHRAEAEKAVNGQPGWNYLEASTSKVYSHHRHYHGQPHREQKQQQQPQQHRHHHQFSTVNFATPLNKPLDVSHSEHEIYKNHMPTSNKNIAREFDKRSNDLTSRLSLRNFTSTSSNGSDFRGTPPHGEVNAAPTLRVPDSVEPKFLSKKTEDFQVKSNSESESARASIGNRWNRLDGENANAMSKKERFELSDANDEIHRNRIGYSGIHSSENLKSAFGYLPDTWKIGNNVNGNGPSIADKPKFPPVPQSNYDLNRHIYDCMTGANKSGRLMNVPFDKSDLRSSYYRDKNGVSNGEPAKIHPIYRDCSVDGEGSRHTISINREGDKKAPKVHQLTSSDGAVLRPNVLSPSPANFNPERCVSRTSTSTFYGERIKSGVAAAAAAATARSNTPYDPQREGNRSDNVNVKNSGDLFASIPSSQSKVKDPENATIPVRSKRESPLDLSVKTVRQSADSTAKDEGDTFYGVQNFRNFQQQDSHSVGGFSAVRSSHAFAGPPKIDFTPNFSGFHAENSGAGNASQRKSDVSILPPVESLKRFQGKAFVSANAEVKAEMNFSSSSSYAPLLPVPRVPAGTDSSSVKYPTKPESQKRLLKDVSQNHMPLCKISKLQVPGQEIEHQRLPGRASLLNNNENSDHPCNGIEKSKSFAVSLPRSSFNRNYPVCEDRDKNPGMYSHSPYNPANSQQPRYRPATPQTPQDRSEQSENSSHLPDPEQIIKQISRGIMPDYKLLQDKNVLNLLRSSLEEKEAKLMQLKEAAKRKEKLKETAASDINKTRFQPYDTISRGCSQNKQSLPPFGDLTLDRMRPPSKNNSHPSDETVAIDGGQNDVDLRTANELERNAVLKGDASPPDGAQEHPTDLDGLAAFLAARIRTKGELKQVGNAAKSHPDKRITTLPLSGSSDFPQQTSHGGSVEKSPLPIASTTPPKLYKESRLLTPLRRHFSGQREEEEAATSSGKASESSSLPSRDPNGIRSSSETSVFDFRDSDSEAEMPVLEKQTLEEMRKDKRSCDSACPGEKSEVEKPEILAALDQNSYDPFWDTTFDMFVEQLKKRPPKRSSRKKKLSGQTSHDDFSLSPDSEKTREAKTIPGDADVDGNVEEERGAETLPIKTDLIKKEPCTEKSSEKTQFLTQSNSRLEPCRPIKSEPVNECSTEQRCENKKESNRDAKATGAGKENKSGIKTRRETAVNRKKDKNNSKDCDRNSRTGSSAAKRNTIEFSSDDDDDYEGGENDNDEHSEDDGDSLSLSGLESESSESETSSDSCSSDYSSSEDSENGKYSKKRMRMQTRLQTRSSKQKQAKSTGMNLRSKKKTSPPAAKAGGKPKRKEKVESFSCRKVKKPAFGDGSAFRPGWEEECYKFKQQLRMPEKLISISRPSKRPSASLPDLDPYGNSSSRDSSEVSATKKSHRGKATSKDEETSERVKTGGEGTQSRSGSDGNVSQKSRNGKKPRTNSILNLLVKKYGKGTAKKREDLKCANEKRSPRILPKGSNKPELLPTPSLAANKENTSSGKRKSENAEKDIGESTSSYLGYFRKKTVDNFKEAFTQNPGLISQDFSPAVLESRTRRQARDLMKRATLIEVFGDERPASAPPLSRNDDVALRRDKTIKVTSKKKGKGGKKGCGGMVTRGRGKLVRGGRPGLRSTAVLRSSKAIQMSKRHLNAGRKRSLDLLRMRALASKKFSYLVKSSEGGNQLPITKKRLKLRSVRRKFRSGFDYIRKKKKLKRDGDSADGSVKEKKASARVTAESVEDVQNEIKNWVINKGLGETILHRAARLGYTDVAAYCLEKMGSSPSPRDNAGYTPLHEACSRGHLEVAKLLLMYGASVSESAKGGIRPLHEAAENGFTELIRLLLSFGADPLLETYTGHTALSLVTDEEARRLMQHHLADVQGNVAPMWTFLGPSSFFDPVDSGYDPLGDPPSPDLPTSEYEFEISDSMLPPLYRLTADRDPDRHWMLMTDLLSCTRLKSKELLLKQLESSSIREMKASDFNDQSRCCSLLNAEKPRAKAAKVVLVRYDDEIRRILDVEKVLL